VGARGGSTSEHALEAMAWMAFTTAALLAPWIARDRRGLVFACCISVAFIQAAALLSQNDTARTAVAMGSAVLWLVGLATINHMLRSQRGGLLMVALSTSVVIGSLLVSYLRREFGAP
jgi:hypothetical protein